MAREDLYRAMVSGIMQRDGIDREQAQDVADEMIEDRLSSIAKMIDEGRMDSAHILYSKIHDVALPRHKSATLSVNQLQKLRDYNARLAADRGMKIVKGRLVR